MIRSVPSATAVVLGIACGLAAAAVPLPQLDIDRSQTTVSGLSSGGFMASQLGYAFSSTFRGVGVFAAGPYMCAGHSHYSACMYNATVSPAMLGTMQADINNWSGTAIDPKSNVASQKVYLFVGTADTTVGPKPMSALRTQYADNGVAAAAIDFVQRSGVAHVFPTDFDGAGNNACGSSASPYVANCGYDGAKAAFTRFYGALAARNDAPASSNYIEFDQSAFTGNPGMAATGWVYVPADCRSGAVCRLHVALHGCQQNAATIGDRFIRNTGYTRWADTNRIVVLFPQTRVDGTRRATSASGSLANANGCWDWIGWYGRDFAQRAGSQHAAIKAMVDRISSGSGGGGGGGGGMLPAPTGVATSGATAGSMTIAWNAVSNAAGYNVYRDDGRANAALVTATSFVDGGLAPATRYAWTVAAVDGTGLEGARSAAASGSTTGAAATCHTATNYAHVGAGRAYHSGGYAHANGSNQNMGLWNVYVTTTLKQTGTNHYVIGGCP